MSASSLDTRSAVTRNPAADLTTKDLGFFVVVLLLAAGCFVDLLYPYSFSGTVIQATWSVIYLVTAALLVRRFGVYRLVGVVYAQLSLFLVVGIAFLSITWSILPSTTFDRATALAGTTLVGVYIGLRFSPVMQVRLLSAVFAFILVLSTLVALAIPGYGSMHLVAGWKGILAHKNALGPLAGVATVFYLARLLSSDPRRRSAMAVFGISCLVVVMSHSATGLLIAGAGSWCLLLLRGVRAANASVTTMLSIIALLSAPAAALVLFAPALVIDVLGRDSTLTGRTEVWAYAVDLIRQRPITGYGYAAILNYYPLGSLTEVSAEAWTHAHNGYLNLASQLGIPAACIAVYCLLRAIFLTTAAALRRPSAYTRFAAVFCLILPIYNLSESVIFRYQNIMTILFVAILVSAVTALRSGHRAAVRQLART